MDFFTSRFGADAVSAATAGFGAAFGREVVDLEELVFFELAGLATTFFGETGLVFFDADFPVAAFVFAALRVVFFEVPFFLEALVALEAPVAVPRLVARLVAFLRLDVPARLAVFFRVEPVTLRVELVVFALAVVPVFFFFFLFAAALLPGI